MSVTILGRVVGKGLAMTQRDFPPYVRRVLVRAGLAQKQKYVLVCNGTVGRRPASIAVRAYRSQLVERTIMFEAFPRKGCIGIVYSLTVPTEVDEAEMFAALSRMTGDRIY